VPAATDHLRVTLPNGGGNSLQNQSSTITSVYRNAALTMLARQIAGGELTRA